MGAKGDTIVVPKDSPIKSVADLKGKKVAVAEGSSANYNLLAQLAKAGLSYDDIEVKTLQPADALAAFSNKHVDAWAIWDPYTSQAELEADARILVDGGGLVNGMTFQAANPDALDDKATRAALRGLPRSGSPRRRCGATPTATSGRRSGPRRPACRRRSPVARSTVVGEADADQHATSPPRSRRWPTRSCKAGLLPEKFDVAKFFTDDYNAARSPRPDAPTKETRMSIKLHWFLPTTGDARSLVGGGHSVPQGVGRPDRRPGHGQRVPRGRHRLPRDASPAPPTSSATRACSRPRARGARTPGW